VITSIKTAADTVDGLARAAADEAKAIAAREATRRAKSHLGKSVDRMPEASQGTGAWLGGLGGGTLGIAGGGLLGLPAGAMFHYLRDKKDKSKNSLLGDMMRGSLSGAAVGGGSGAILGSLTGNMAAGVYNKAKPVVAKALQDDVTT
jgi:hypothetical protein